MVNIIDIEKEYKDRLEKLWNNTKSGLDSSHPAYKSIERGYAIERSIERDSILFIGMNPSFKEGAWNNGISTQSVFYEIPKQLTANKKGTNPFFRAINAFYDGLKCPNKPPLAHHDFLFIRETNQKAVIDWKEKQLILDDFFKAQMTISKEIIIKTNPILVVVLNAGARILFKELFGECELDSKIGARIYCFNEKKIPVLFSGMLSGQRALDLGSQESLKWHIEYILKQIP